MGNRYLTVVFTFLLAFLTGCATPHSHLISKKEPLIDREHGLVVVSLGSGTMSMPAIDGVTTQADGKPADFRITTTANMLVYGAWDAKEAVRPGPAGGRRVLLAYSVAPGDYSISAVHLYIPSYPATYSGKVQFPRPYRFGVEAGKVTYLGVVEVNMTTAPNVIGEIIPALSMQVPARMSVRLLDEFEEDNKILITMRPELKAAPVLLPAGR
ncbi:hypothetical protein [Ottowia thiooxydans]|uniref:hypothetical protein n=1 Tax=Ottowia thiooxydans TaxID=219182 RepID=UPI0012EB30CE|nr:hypothetical protein [Ottowia thiooxydans]